MPKARLTALKPKLQTIGDRIKPMPAPSRATDYRIRGRELQRIREHHFREHPLCVHCIARGIVTPATELDHIVALVNGGTDTPDNRQGLCTNCHAAKTAQDLAVSPKR